MKTNLRKLIAITATMSIVSTSIAFANANAIEIEVPNPSTVDLMLDTPAMNPDVVAPVDGGLESIIQDGIMTIGLTNTPATNPDLVPPAIGGVDMPMLDAVGAIAPSIVQTGTIGDIAETTNPEDAQDEFTSEKAFEIFMEDETGGLRFMVQEGTRILDRATNEYIFAEDLTVGMEVTVVYSSLAPVGMSLPPFVGQISTLIVNVDAGPVAVGQFDSELFSIDANLQLNIDEENTALVFLNGARMPLTVDMIKNNGTAIVFYDMATRSIPAQTTPSHIFFIADEVQEDGENLGLAPLDASSSVEGDILDPETGLPYGFTAADGARPILTMTAEAPEFVAVRATAEAVGYTVTWQGNDLPIIVENDSVKLEITVGSDVYLENGVEITAPQTAEIVDGNLFAAINF